MRHCQRCHDCGEKLLKVEYCREWCPTCQTHRSYRSHGSILPGASSGCCWTVSHNLLLRPIRPQAIPKGDHFDELDADHHRDMGSRDE